MLAASLFLTSLLAGSALAAPPLHKRKVFDIAVGKDGLNFDPPAIFAEIGDTVRFIFQGKNHTVTQSSFAEPCGKKEGGFNTGFVPVAPGTTPDQLPIKEYTVTTPKDTPLWFYCAQALHTPDSHCFKGMVFSINCPATGENSFDNFKSKAMSDAFATNAAPAPGPSPTGGDIIPLAPEPSYGASITVPASTPAETITAVVTLNPTSSWTTTYASYPGSPDPTPSSAEGSEIKVLVGKNGLTFEPAHVVAKPRDRIVFEFYPKNHSLVQSSFAAPCSKFRTLDGAPGINSGFMPPVEGQPNPTFTVLVNNTEPLYFYCSQANHCGQGMVFAVNTDENGARSSTAFQTLAKQINGTSSGTAPPPPGAAMTLGVSIGGVAIAGVLATAAALVL